MSDDISEAAKLKACELRFLAKVEEQDDGCWTWLGNRTSRGYGRFWFGGRMDYAHRAAVHIWGRELPAGKVVDHLCGNPSCVNPKHLDVVSQQENVRRGGSIAARKARANRATHCKRGHPWTPENTYNATGQRVCRTCAREKVRRHQAKQRQVAEPVQ